MQWEPIETAPKDGQTILLGTLDNEGNWSGGTFSRWCDAFGWRRDHDPTHWMKIEPPKGTKKDNSL